MIILRLLIYQNQDCWININMKIYLLILALVIITQGKYRNLKNVTIFTSSPPKVLCISPTELALSSQTNLVTYNITNDIVLQNITLGQQSPVQILPLQSALIYLNNSVLYQAHSNSSDKEYFTNISSTSWPSKISSYQSKFITGIYDSAGSPTEFKIYGPKPWDIQAVTWQGLEGSTITGASNPSLLANNEFYFAAGGVCNEADGLIYFQKGSADSVENIYNFTIGSCSFGDKNKDWVLQTYQTASANYHLLNYVAVQDSPFRHSFQLVSSANGEFTEVSHFEMDRIIGFHLASQKVIYTADNLLCRVVEHNIDNHQHQHQASFFKSQPLSIFVTPSQNRIVTIENSQSFSYTAALLYTINSDQNITQEYYIYGVANVLRAQILSQTYIFYNNDGVNKSLSLWNIFDTRRAYKTNLNNVTDFCVSNQDKLFVLHVDDILGQILGVYSMVNDQFVKDTQATLMGLVYQSITCLDNNFVFLKPAAGRDMEIYQYGTTLDRFSTLQRDDQIHANFTYSKDILIFTNNKSNQSVFYNYSFSPLAQTFNLPPSSSYKIIQSHSGQLIIAVGDDIDSYSSLEYYTNENSIITYKGSFPFIDDGIADIQRTVLFPSRGRLHLQFQSDNSIWSTYFDLASPPLQSIGYFYDPQYNDCSFFDEAVFRITPTKKQLLILNNNETYPVLQKYTITNTLTKTESYPLNKYLTTKMGLQLANNNQLIIRGILVNRTFNFQVRNIDLLSTIIYSNVELDSINNIDLQAVDFVDGAMISLFSTNLTLTLLFKINTQYPIALQTSIFSTITSFATCPNCNKIAFTGTSVDTAASPSALVGDYTDPTLLDSVDLGCSAGLLALSPDGTLLAWSCPNSKLFAYDLVKKIPLALSYPNYTSIYQLSFIDDFSLIANLDQTIQKVSIQIFILSSSSFKATKDRVGSVTSYAVDYTQKIYAVAENASTILIYSFNDTLLQTLTINNTLDIASLSFDSDGQLFVVNIAGTVFGITQAPCPINKQLIGDYCLCRSLFVADGDQCFCNDKYQDGFCLCNDGNYLNGGSCESCSAMCSTCNSGGAFDCEKYSAGFFVIIVGGSLVVLGLITFVVVKVVKKKQKQDSMFTEEKTKLSDPIQPTLKDDIMVRSSFQ